MTRDDIIWLAREAGSIDSEEVIETVWAAFTAAEREACAKIVEESSLPDAYSEPVLLDIADDIRARGEK